MLVVQIFYSLYHLIDHFGVQATFEMIPEMEIHGNKKTPVFHKEESKAVYLNALLQGEQQCKSELIYRIWIQITLISCFALLVYFIHFSWVPLSTFSYGICYISSILLILIFMYHFTLSRYLREEIFCHKRFIQVLREVEPSGK